MFNIQIKMAEYSRKFNSKKRNRTVKGKGLTTKQKIQVEKMIKDPAEKKYYDITYSSQAISITPGFTDLFQPALGGTSIDRIGAQVTLQNISYKLRFLLGDSTNYIRMVLFQWMSDTANDVPSWAQIFAFNPPIVQSDFMSPLLLGDGNQRNFKVIKQIDFNLDAADGPVALVHGFIDKGFKKTIYFADNAVTGMNHIYCMFISDSGAIQHPVVDGYFRFRFTDE